jgi:cyclopropane-fatty-acyl-phospholipid synthase
VSTPLAFAPDRERNLARSGARGLERAARRAVHARLGALEGAALTLVEDGRAERFGDAASGLAATVRVHDPGLHAALLLRGSLGGAEAYLDGRWDADDLVAVVRVLARNRRLLEGLEGGLAPRLARAALLPLHWARRNTRSGSRRNIAAHYDLGNEFFALFLDPTLTYSCGIFESHDATLEEASRAKYERACRWLELGPADHVLEIGSGWGGFAIHAASRFGCRVTTTTISRRQWELARERVAAAGLADRVEVRLEDYRDLRGQYDKLVSIEMIEAVGHAQLPAFFGACHERLRPGGAMFLQAITNPERDYAASLRNVDFVKRYVFPGGQLVSIGAICAAAARSGALQPVRLEDVTPHYAETIRCWRARMASNRAEMRALGLDERFLRLWDFYLAYCEGGFRERAIHAIQMRLERTG